MVMHSTCSRTCSKQITVLSYLRFIVLLMNCSSARAFSSSVAATFLFRRSPRPTSTSLVPEEVLIASSSSIRLSMSTESEPVAKRQKIQGVSAGEEVPLYRGEGLFAVNKPLEWTSNDVVSYIRGILERDARSRGAKVVKPGRRRKKGVVKVGHGGTLDPLASGVLVIGVGSGTKELQTFLSGSKRYRAGVKLGFETETLDMEGNVTDTKPFDHVSLESIQHCIPNSFTGEIMQVPPIYSALRKNGKKLYEEARAGKTASELGIEARKVHIYDLKLRPTNEKGEGLPCFGLDVECGGGTYIRSLVRDLGRELDTCATMTSLVRTQQAQFLLDDTLDKDDLNADAIYAAIDKTNAVLRTGLKGE
eukprot:CAMPEP_0178657008 /NCGR_PEP_ID=MMETSP0698-20121128/25136_1 /TAXON_ID=265572 /ORGANISM="Extubocellulus spinifer, Strain CCMP396" /LENGTH=362 /DNA_ID=CAMNT_0020299117 /DNA_START=34 /DNA_END=1119 /DNA_ORIENTATION=-